MRVSLRVIPRAKRPSIHTAPDGSLVVKVSAPAESGRANAAVIQAAAAHFGVPQRAVTLVAGASSRHKIIDVLK